jgi:hypothetical protein
MNARHLPVSIFPDRLFLSPARGDLFIERNDIRPILFLFFGCAMALCAPSRNRKAKSTRGLGSINRSPLAGLQWAPSRSANSNTRKDVSNENLSGGQPG